MLNFTEEIKNEIVKNKLEKECCKAALLAAFIRTSGSILSRDGCFGFELVTENERTAYFITDIMENTFGMRVMSGVRSDMMSGKDKITLQCVSGGSTEFLKKTGIVGEENGEYFLTFGIGEALTERECCRAAFMKGAFLGGGSCTLPDKESYSRTGYHLEIVFSNKLTANEFCELLCDFEILAKCVTRKDSAVVYVKSKEVISDFLHALSADECLEKLNGIVEYKDKTNHANRVNNCSVSNIDKTLTASVNLVRAIEVISETVGLQRLDKMLFEVAEARLADKNASMQELADRLGISKSCINHRMRKILEIAKTLSQD